MVLLVNMQKDIVRYKAMNSTYVDEKCCRRFLYILPWSPLFSLAVYRYNCFIDKRWGKDPTKKPVRLIFKAFYHMGRFLSVIMQKTQIEEDVQIAEGVYLSPKGGQILGAHLIGKGCTIHHNVTIGFSFGRGRKMQRPDIGENVWIGPDTIIYGNIKVGDGAVIGPKTVVNKSVPPRCMVYGNPARIIKKDINNTKLHQTDLPDIYKEII
jgi:serine O-acetyltransferase